MKLTWFGGTTMRIHIGGTILVMDAEGAPEGIDQAELVSGADRVFGMGDGLAAVDSATWRPRRAGRLVDEGERGNPVEIWAAGEGAVLVDAVGEPPLVLAGGSLPEPGRWGTEAVFVLFGDGPNMSGLGEALLDVTAPKLIALAGDEAAVEFAIEALRERLDGAGLMSLEAGLAVEV